jgi:hypothetical protein
MLLAGFVISYMGTLGKYIGIIMHLCSSHWPTIIIPLLPLPSLPSPATTSHRQSPPLHPNVVLDLHHRPPHHCRAPSSAANASSRQPLTLLLSWLLSTLPPHHPLPAIPSGTSCCQPLATAHCCFPCPLMTTRCSWSSRGRPHLVRHDQGQIHWPGEAP